MGILGKHLLSSGPRLAATPGAAPLSLRNGGAAGSRAEPRRGELLAGGRVSTASSATDFMFTSALNSQSQVQRRALPSYSALGGGRERSNATEEQAVERGVAAVERGKLSSEQSIFGQTGEG